MLKYNLEPPGPPPVGHAKLGTTRATDTRGNRAA